MMVDRLTKVYFEVPNEPYLNVELSSFPGYKGLQGRLFLPEDDCMVFDHQGEGYHYFWMGSVAFPLDIIFINDGLEIVTILHNIPPNFSNAFTSDEPARYVVEANGGWCERSKVAEGAKVRFQGIWKPL